MSVTLSPGSLVATNPQPGELAPRRRRFAWLLAGLAALLPALPWLIALPGFGRLPSNDYYAVLLQMGRPDGGFVRQPAAWLGMRSNEHHVAVPALVYAANILLCDGDNRGLSAWCLLVLGATLALLLSLLPSVLRRQPALFALVGLLLGVLVFNPVQAHNVIMGFSGVMWLTANLLAVAALAALCRHARDGRRRWLAVALACAWAGVFTYSSNLSLWPSLLAAALVLRVRWPALATMVAGAVTAVAFDVATYVRPPDHPELGAEAGGTLWGFVARYVGSLVTAEDLAALLLGGLALAASAALWILLALRRRPLAVSLCPWLALEVYALGNALGTAVARSGFGPEAAFASRYASLAALAWIGLLIPLAAWWMEEGPAPGPAPASAIFAGGFAVLLLVAAISARGYPLFDDLLQRARRQGEAVVALHAGLRVDAALSAVTAAPGQVWANLPFMRARGHVPFDRPLPFALGQPIDPSRVRTGDGAPVSGEIERATARRTGEATGWVRSGRARVEWIVLVDPTGVVHGGGSPGFPYRRGRGRRAELIGWRARFRRHPRLERVEAYAMLEGDSTFYRLSGWRPVAARRAPAR